MKNISPVFLFLLQTSIFCSTGNALSVPDFISHIPPGHYAGVSTPCNDLQKARSSALSDVVKQILGSINTEFNYIYSGSVSGNPESPTILIKDDFSGMASGIVLDVEKNIVQSSWGLDDTGRYISFILVRYSELQIEKMRRLTKGGKAVASVLSESDGVLRVKLTEINGVAVTLVSADISISKKNRFAGMINYFIWKVPFGSNESFTTALSPVEICGGTSVVQIDISRFQKKLMDWLLGASMEFELNIKGVDEIGRDVSVDIKF